MGRNHYNVAVIMLQLGLLDVIAFYNHFLSGGLFIGGLRYEPMDGINWRSPGLPNLMQRLCDYWKENGFAPRHLEIKTFKHILDALLRLIRTNIGMSTLLEPREIGLGLYKNRLYLDLYIIRTTFQDTLLCSFSASMSSYM